MDMINMAFKCQDLDPGFLTFSHCQFLEPLFHSGNIEDLPPVTGVEYEMVVDQRDSGFRMSIHIFHTFIIQQM